MTVKRLLSELGDGELELWMAYRSLNPSEVQILDSIAGVLGIKWDRPVAQSKEQLRANTDALFAYAKAKQEKNGGTGRTTQNRHDSGNRGTF